MIDYLRKFVKTRLQAHPGLYQFAKSVYGFLKNRLDTWRVRRQYPDVKFLKYSAEQIKSFQNQGYNSQFGQDYYLFNEIFQKSSTGVFLDIGCNHPIANSNSRFLEMQGWTGHAFDPLARFEAAWGAERQARFHRVAIGAQSGQIDFVEFLGNAGWEHQLSGFADGVRAEDLAIHAHRRYPVPVGPVAAFVPGLDRVDLLMIDVEGAELQVIDGCDLDTLRPRWLLIENVRRIGGDEALRQRLRAAGYVLRVRIAANDDLFERAAP